MKTTYVSHDEHAKICDMVVSNTLTDVKAETDEKYYPQIVAFYLQTNILMKKMTEELMNKALKSDEFLKNSLNRHVYLENRMVFVSEELYDTTVDTILTQSSLEMKAWNNTTRDIMLQWQPLDVYLEMQEMMAKQIEMIIFSPDTVEEDISSMS